MPLPIRPAFKHFSPDKLINNSLRTSWDIAPLGWEHIRLIGDYHFAPQSGRSLEHLRPLRLQEGQESA